MKLIVAGSRTITDYSFLCKAMQRFLENEIVEEIVSGGARGVDSLAEKYAHEKRIRVKKFDAQWERLGKKAGMVRNGEMATYADALLLIWDGKSVGSKHMKGCMELLNKPIYEAIVGEL